MVEPWSSNVISIALHKNGQGADMLIVKRFKALLGLDPSSNTPQEKAERKERQRVQEVLRRQRQLQRQEIVQEWRLVLGRTPPKRKRDTLLLTNITRRNVWMEPRFLLDQIQRLVPEEVLHAAEQYVLQWTAPGSHFASLIPLHDCALQENAILVMAQLSRREQRKILFFFTTVDPSLSLFAPRVHPASLVSYRTRNEVLAKLSTLYLQGALSTEEIQGILACEEDVWRPALYNLLPADEQVFHSYLNETRKRESEDKEKKTVARSYLDGEITLREYEDLTFPERQKRREMEMRDYPLPVSGKDCVICGKEGAGVISCHTCENHVCVRCVKRVFHGREDASPERESDGEKEHDKEHERERRGRERDRTESSVSLRSRTYSDRSARSSHAHTHMHSSRNRTLSESSTRSRTRASERKSRTSTRSHTHAHTDTETDTHANANVHKEKKKKIEREKESFLLMHIKYCLRLGALPPVHAEVVGEPAFLRELRRHTRPAALQKLLPKYDEQRFLDELDMYINDEEMEKEERERQAREEEELRRVREREALARKQAEELENPMILQEKRIIFEDRKRRFEKIKRSILTLNDRINDPTHTEQFVSRTARLRLEEIAKMHKMVATPLKALQKELEEMQLPGAVLPALREEVRVLLEELPALCSPQVPPPTGEERMRSRRSSRSSHATSANVSRRIPSLASTPHHLSQSSLGSTSSKS